MKRFMSSNIDKRGRLVLGFMALLLFAGAGFAFLASVWIGAALLAIAAFVAFEALRGWCALRACGVKTRL